MTLSFKYSLLEYVTFICTFSNFLFGKSNLYNDNF